MNIDILSSAIKKEHYTNSIMLYGDNKKILTIDVLSNNNYNELSFKISDFFGSWFSYKRITKIIEELNGNAQITECLNREYMLRLWLVFIGFKKKVVFPDYFNLNGKKYSYLILEYSPTKICFKNLFGISCKRSEH